MTASVIKLVAPASVQRVARSVPAAVVQLSIPKIGERAAARHMAARRLKLWERAWNEYQGYQTIERLVGNLFVLKRRGGKEASELLKQYGYILEQRGSTLYSAAHKSLAHLLLTPAPTAAALAWKKAKVKKATLEKGELVSILHQITADEERLSSAPRKAVRS